MAVPALEARLLSSQASPARVVAVLRRTLPDREVNNTFYNLPENSVFEHWRASTPEDFLFALKMSRYLTHLKRLQDPTEPVHRFIERARGLGSKLGPVLLQLPPRFKVNLRLLEETLVLFDRAVRVAVEFCDETWFTA